MKAIGLILVVLGTAPAAYSIPMASFVALGAFVLGVGMVIFGIRLFAGMRRAR